MEKNYLQEEFYALLKNDQRIFSFIQEASLDGLWYWDLEHTENEWMDRKFWVTLGYNPDEMPHKAYAWQDIIFAEDLKVASANAAKHFENPDHPYDQIVRYKHKKGHTVWVRCRGLAIRDNDGKPIRMIGAHTDVTFIKQKEAELQETIKVTNDQNERLKNFAHIVSHNLNSHSANLTMLVDFLFTDHPEMKNSEIGPLLNMAANNLKNTIEHLTEVVSITNTTAENLVDISLTNCVKETLEGLRTFAFEQKTKLYNKVQDPFIIKGVRAYVDSIILNFLNNAIKYGDPEKKNRSVTITAKSGKKYIILTIEDNGLGIDLNANGNKLFGMYKTFHQNKNSRGLGLFISKTQLESIGGKVTVESEVGVGTTFKLYFKK